MRAIIIVMLAVQAAIFCVAVFAIALRKPSAKRPAPIWSSFAISLLVVGNVSIQIAGDHPGASGAEVLYFGGAMLIGMALTCALLLFRERREGTRGSDRRSGAVDRRGKPRQDGAD